ncbi:unnamed protein product [Clavelina lepadiformis]|uniref:Uncharacterized protein n=1 Tax=Clavelina lepadiformis TaxID=159417 RepID=A0ABP0FJR2_CLALP
MGQSSSYFTEEEEKEIIAKHNINARYLQEIQKRYNQLETSKKKDETSGVTVQDTLLIREVHGNKLATLLAENYGGKDGVLYPHDFVNFFGDISSQKTPNEKVEILFHLLDVKNFGYLAGIEMYRYYHTLLSPSLNNEQIEQITKNALKIGGNKIDLKKFKQLMPAWQVAEKMTVNLQITE